MCVCVRAEKHKEEVVRNVFRKARAKAKEELGAQLRDFQLKRQVGLGALYGPDDAVLDKCAVDRAQVTPLPIHRHSH